MPILGSQGSLSARGFGFLDLLPQYDAWQQFAISDLYDYADPTTTGPTGGKSISISDDGSRTIIGSSELAATASVHVVLRNGVVLTTESTITPPTGSETEFGFSVAIAGDSTRLIIGSPNDDTIGTNDGAAYVYSRSGTTWTFEQELNPPTSNGTQFGTVVEINQSGNTVVVADDSGDEPSPVANVYVFTRSGTTWSQQATLQSGNVSDDYGVSLGINNAANLIVVGAADARYVYVYSKSGNTWSLQQQLTSGNVAVADQFGWSVDISGDGNYIVVGAQLASPPAIHIFNRSGNTWTSQQVLSAGSASLTVGHSVAINNDGSRVVVGNGSGTDVYFFQRAGNTWTQAAAIPTQQTGTLFGWTVDISGDGEYAVIGAAGSGDVTSGRAYFYRNND